MSTFLSPAQAAQVAQVSRRTITRAISAQALRATRDNKNQWRIRPEDLEAWRSAQGAHWAPTEQAQEDAHVAHPDAHPAQEDAHPDKALRDEVEGLRRDLAVAMVRAERAEDQLQRERELADRAREAHQDAVVNLRKLLDEEREDRRQLQRQLAPPTRAQGWPAEVVNGEGAANRPRGFLGRLWGR